MTLDNNYIKNGDFKDSTLEPWTSEQPTKVSFGPSEQGIGIPIYLKEGSWITQELGTLPGRTRLDFDVKLIIPQDEAALFSVMVIGFTEENAIWFNGVLQLAGADWQHFSVALEPRQKINNCSIQATASTPSIKNGKFGVRPNSPEYPFAPIAFANFKLV